MPVVAVFCWRCGDWREATRYPKAPEHWSVNVTSHGGRLVDLRYTCRRCLKWRADTLATLKAENDRRRRQGIIRHIDVLRVQSPARRHNGRQPRQAPP